MKYAPLVFASITFLALSTQYAAATSCIQRKRFNVKQVCGIVVGPGGEPIADVLVELLDSRTDVPGLAENIKVDNKGRFILREVPAGKYEVRVRLSGFATASQNIMLTKDGDNSGCKSPITIQMQVAGLCSTVSPAHK